MWMLRVDLKLLSNGRTSEVECICTLVEANICKLLVCFLNCENCFITSVFVLSWRRPSTMLCVHTQYDIVLYHKAYAAFVCICTTLNTNFDSFPFVGQYSNPARANNHSMKAKSICFRSFVAMEDQKRRATVPKIWKVAKPLNSGQKLINIFIVYHHQQMHN
jgi:hypothetical protein